MLINPRLPFLFLFVGSFMGLWSQDVQPSAESVIAEAFARSNVQNIAVVDELPEPTEVPEPVLAVNAGSDLAETDSIPAVVPVSSPADEVVEVVKTVSSSPTEQAVEFPTPVEAESTPFDLELPDTIAAGFYRAVNHAGQVRIVHIGQNEANAGVPVRDFYTHEIGYDRWYLIRLDAQVLALDPHRELY